MKALARITMMMMVLVVSATAKEPHYPAPESISCWKIRFYVLRYGENAAYEWATARYNESQIQGIRKRCALNWNG